MHSSLPGLLMCLFSHRNIPWIMLVTDMGSSLQTLPDCLLPSLAVVLCLPPCLASSSWLGGKHWQRQPKLQTLLCSQLHRVFIVSWLVCVSFVIYLHRCFFGFILLFIGPVGGFSSLTTSQITSSSRDNIY